MPAYSESGLDDGEDLSFGNHVVKVDQDGFELARGGRSHRNFHLHRFDECNVFAIADAAADFDGKRADAAGPLGPDLDVRHSVLRALPPTISPAYRFLFWRAVAL